MKEVPSCTSRQGWRTCFRISIPAPSSCSVGRTNGFGAVTATSAKFASTSRHASTSPICCRVPAYPAVKCYQPSVQFIIKQWNLHQTWQKKMHVLRPERSNTRFSLLTPWLQRILLVSHCAGPSSTTGQSLWDLRWTMWLWGNHPLSTSVLPCQFPFHQSSIFTCHHEWVQQAH